MENVLYCQLCNTDVTDGIEGMSKHIADKHDLSEIAKSISCKKSTQLGYPPEGTV